MAIFSILKKDVDLEYWVTFSLNGNDKFNEENKKVVSKNVNFVFLVI